VQDLSSARPNDDRRARIRCACTYSRECADNRIGKCSCISHQRRDIGVPPALPELLIALQAPTTRATRCLIAPPDARASETSACGRTQVVSRGSDGSDPTRHAMGAMFVPVANLSGSILLCGNASTLCALMTLQNRVIPLDCNRRVTKVCSVSVSRGCLQTVQYQLSRIGNHFSFRFCIGAGWGPARPLMMAPTSFRLTGTCKARHSSADGKSFSDTDALSGATTAAQSITAQLRWKHCLPACSGTSHTCDGEVLSRICARAPLHRVVAEAPLSVGSLAVFTCSGRGISEGTYKDLHKDGTGGKKKGKKKK
jgi:hypothetical protein